MKTVKSVMARRQRGDAGMAFMIELLIVMALVVGLVAIVGPKMMDYLNRGQDSSVQSDLANYATAAEANLINNGGSSYEAASTIFSTDGSAPVASQDNRYKAWVIEQGTNAGYVIVGINRNSEQLWGVSSYNGGSVVKIDGADSWSDFDSFEPTVGGPLNVQTVTSLEDVDEWPAGVS